jgi:type I restriction enzyme S subunit
MSSWPQVFLSDIFDIARGGSPRPIQDYITDQPDGINWITIADASEGSKYITATKRRIRKEGVNNSRMVHPGDFLLTNSMSFGRPYIMQTSGCIHDGWLVFSMKKPNVDQDFFFHLLESNAVYSQFERLAAGATVKNLNIELVKGVKVPLPPLPEQRRIAEVLDRAEVLRAKRRAALAHLDTLSQSIFLTLFGDPATNPKDFPIKRLADLVREDDTINYGVVQPGDDLDEGVPLVRVGDLLGGKISHASLKRIAPAIEAAYKRSRLRGDEILVSCVGSIGLVALVSSTEKGFNIARAVARIPLAGSTNREFMATYLRTDFVQRYFTNELRTVSQPTLNIKQLSETAVVLPPLALQLEFARRIAAVEKLKSAHYASLATLDELFASLQHRAFRGEL